MTEGPRLRICRCLVAAAVAAYCLWQGIVTASPYFGCSDALSYLSDWRSAARNAPEGRLALLCSDVCAISPIERSRLVAMSWERAPVPIATVDAKSDLTSVDVVLSPRWIPRSTMDWLKGAGFSVSAMNEYMSIWSASNVAPCDLDIGEPRVSRAREVLSLAVELALMILVFAAVSTLRDVGKWQVVAALTVVLAMGAVALSHPLLAPNGLGVYGGKAKLLYEYGRIPDAFLDSAGGSVLQPSYPPGLALLACLHFALSGGCGDRLVQMLVAFALALVCLAMARKAARWHDVLPALLFCLSPLAVKMSAGFYAEPFAALMLVLGWGLVGRGKLFGGGLVMGLAGLFRPEAGVVAVVFATGACVLRYGAREKLKAVALATVPTVLWIGARMCLGIGGVSDWDFCSAPDLAHVAYAAWCEVKALGMYVVPIAAIEFLVHPRVLSFSTRETLLAFVSAAFLLLAIPFACAFHISPHAHWMIDNTIPRLMWYISAVPLFQLIARFASNADGT